MITLNFYCLYINNKFTNSPLKSCKIETKKLTNELPVVTIPKSQENKENLRTSEQHNFWWW